MNGKDGRGVGGTESVAEKLGEVGLPMPVAELAAAPPVAVIQPRLICWRM